MDNEDSRLARLNRESRESAIRSNELSTEYIKNVNSINNRVVVIAVGSASLLFTFVGILFGSDKPTGSLEYKYVVIAVVAFLLASALLLLSGWFAGIFRYHTVVKHHLLDRVAVRKEELNIARTQRIVSTLGISLSDDELNDYVQKMNEAIAKLRVRKTKAEKLEKVNHLLYRLSFLFGYVVLILGYISTLIFFLGVINIINI